MDPPPIPSKAELPPKRRRRWWRVIGLTLLSLLTATFLIHCIVTRDIAPIDDSDLLLPLKEVDPTQNPYPEILSLSIREEDEPRFKAINLYGFRPVSEEDFDFQLVATLVDEYSSELTKLDRYIEMNQWQISGETGINAPTPELTALMRFAQLRVAQIRRLQRNGKLQKAAEQALQLLKLGSRIESTEQATFLYQVVALTITSSAQTELAFVVSHQELTPDVLHFINSSLDRIHYDTSNLENAMRNEYKSFAALLEDLNAGKIDIDYINDGGDEAPDPKRPNPLFFKLNRTKKLFAEGFRDLIAEAADIRSSSPKTTTHRAYKMSASRTKMYLSGNPVGELMYTFAVSPVAAITDRNAVIRTNHTLLRLQVAATQFQQKNGHWPNTLNELTPEFIDSIPTDLMDGKPLRYNATTRTIYSIGRDFIDARGETEDDKTEPLRDRDEPAIRLEPAA